MKHPSKLDPMTHQETRGPGVLELMDPARRTLLHGSAATALGAALADIARDFADPRVRSA